MKTHSHHTQLLFRHWRSHAYLKKRNIAYITVAFLFFIGIMATIGGLQMISDPSGSSSSLSLQLLQQSPFKNYLLPGIILFLLNGLCSFFVAYRIIAGKDHNPYWIIAQGFALGMWIFTQIFYTEVFRIEHLFYIACALTLMVCGMGLDSTINKKIKNK